jgi:hypothetical protein
MRGMQTVFSVVMAGAMGVVFGCGDAEEPLIIPDGSPDTGAPCAGFRVSVTPTTGEGPLHRSTPIVASWGQGIVDAAFDVRVDGEVVRGATYVHNGSAVFLAERLLPATARVEWRFSACGAMQDGHFNTGALSTPVEVSDVVGRSFGFDLRQLEWEHPTATSTANGNVLRWHLAPSFVVDVTDATLSEATFAIAPAVLSDDGDVVRDLTAGHVEVKASLMQNPYVQLEVPAIELLALDGPVTLRDIELVAGFSDGCFDDTSLVAVMDVRALEKQGKAPCARLMSLTGQSCVPCDDDDLDGGCFLLAAEGVRSVSSSSSSLSPSTRPLP